MTTTPTMRKMMTEVTLRGMLRRMVSRLAIREIRQMARYTKWLGNVLKPSSFTMMEPNVVRPPFGTDEQKALKPASQN